MARKKISEYTAKRLLHRELNLPYAGISVSVDDTFPKLNSQQTYVVKVDEGVKKRMKQGLVLLHVPASEIEARAKKLFAKGYHHVIIEPFLKHDQGDETYLSLSRVRDGIQVLYSDKGGIDIESNQDAIQSYLVPIDDDTFLIPLELNILALPKDFLAKLFSFFITYHFSFFEINPLVVIGDTVSLLDIAAEVDSMADFFVHDGWSEDDFRSGILRVRTPEEQAVSSLAAQSQAALSLEVLNPNGSIFMMLMGGGASIVLADEVYNQGYGKELANYGEFSGNPKAEETYLYAKNTISLLLKSNAKKKVLIIAGGVANFSDVRVAFKGVLKALDEEKVSLRKQGIKVFVRRGGPNQKEGLQTMQTFLEEEELYGIVAGPEMVLTNVVTVALDYLRG